MQYADYSLGAPAANSVPTGQAQHGPKPPVADDPKEDVIVTPKAAGLEDIPRDVPGAGHTEERVEYRDENGKLLDESEVQALEGKVSFSTRYETRTRVLDADGNQIYEEVVDDHAGTIADAPNPETPGLPEGKASDKPAANPVGEDLMKERVADQANSKKAAEPESPVGKVSSKDEL